MRVFEFSYPGTWLDLLDPEQVRNISDILRLLEGHLIDASVALNQFVDSYNKQHYPNRDDHKREFERRWELSAAYERAIGDDCGISRLSPEQHDEVSERVDRSELREWEVRLFKALFQISG